MCILRQASSLLEMHFRNWDILQDGDWFFPSPGQKDRGDKELEKRGCSQTEEDVTSG